MIKEDIKLVIWDMDDTFWKGTISENAQIELIENNINIVKELVDRGIMNSICSKNDFETVKNKLDEAGIFNLFVFPIINWESKGIQIKNTISNMGLRDNNVLFIDDNSTNLNEAKFYCPNLNVESPEVLDKLLNNKFLKGKTDFEHKRLKQYKILEKKVEAKSLAESNEKFLYDSNIRCLVQYDCINNIERIYELINRTNQLNFTKKRIEKDKLEILLKSNEYTCGYVSVEDKYGDYGIVGFYALSKKDNRLEHFLFSCRTIGIGVEQWVYNYLGCPELCVVGETINKVEPNIDVPWINVKTTNVNKIENENEKKNCNILLRGGCDLLQLWPYLDKKSYNVEFEHNEGYFHREHTTLTIGAKTYSEETKRELIDKIPFINECTFETKMYSGKYDIIIMSLLMDYSQTVYQRKDDSDIKLAIGDYCVPLDKDNPGVWNPKELDYFFENFERIGRISEADFYSNLKVIRNYIPKETVMILINGCEVESPKSIEKNRHIDHKKMNDVLDKFISETENTYLLDMRTIVQKQSDLADNIRHYKREMYYLMALELSNIISQSSGAQIRVKKRKLYSIYKDIRKHMGKMIKKIIH